MNKMIDSAQHNSKWIIRKFEAYGDLASEEVCKRYFAGDNNVKPFEIVEIPDNILLNNGITEMWNLITGLNGGGTLFDNVNAQIGVGSDASGEDPAQVTLLDGAAVFVAMDTTFPILGGQTVTWRGIFDGSAANFDWREFAVANGSPLTTGITMNRKQANQGTKANGQTWTLDLAITLS